MTERTVEIVPHREGWSQEFQDLAATLATTLRGLARRVDHIGSTSVPGLAAKDVLDVQVSLDDWSRAAQVRERLEGIGFECAEGITRDHVPPGQPDDPEQWRKLYFRGPAGGRKIHLHVRALGRANQRYALLFRDYLRVHPRSAATYAELKRRLAAVAPDGATYSDTKDPACDLILEAAEPWAAATNWSPA